MKRSITLLFCVGFVLANIVGVSYALDNYLTITPEGPGLPSGGVTLVDPTYTLKFKVSSGIDITDMNYELQSTNAAVAVDTQDTTCTNILATGESCIYAFTFKATKSGTASATLNANFYSSTYGYTVSTQVKTPWVAAASYTAPPGEVGAVSNFLVSADGENWRQANYEPRSDQQITSLESSPDGHWVLALQGENESSTLFFSNTSNLTHWTPATLPSSLTEQTLLSITAIANNGKSGSAQRWLAVGYTINKVSQEFKTVLMQSLDNGHTWRWLAANFDGLTISALNYGMCNVDGKQQACWVMVGLRGISTNDFSNNIVYLLSNNLTQVHVKKLPDAYNNLHFQKISYGNGGWVVFNTKNMAQFQDQKTQLLFSADGVNWGLATGQDAISNQAGIVGTDLKFGGGRWLLVAQVYAPNDPEIIIEGSTVFTSADGNNWTSLNAGLGAPGFPQCNAIAYSSAEARWSTACMGYGYNSQTQTVTSFPIFASASVQSLNSPWKLNSLNNLATQNIINISALVSGGQ